MYLSIATRNLASLIEDGIEVYLQNRLPGTSKHPTAFLIAVDRRGKTYRLNTADQVEQFRAKFRAEGAACRANTSTRAGAR